MSILTLIESSTGNIYRKKATTHGGEFSGPCPWCQGSDRFSIHPENNHFVCRRCKKAGDSVEFVKQYHQKTYIEACKYLNITPIFKPKTSLDPSDPKHQQAIRWMPREIQYPSEVWQFRAEAVLFEAYKYLLSPAGKPHRDWLNSRGINNDTIKTARFGWNTTSIHFDRSSWDLPLEIDKTGKSKSVWIPAGLIIPQFKYGRPIRLRIRQENPINSDRYIMVSGSAMGFFDYSGHIDSIENLSVDFINHSIITESELDGWLLYQELKNDIRVYAIGNSTARPDISTHEYIKNRSILLNLDNDDAGVQEIPWWIKQYPKSIPWFSEFGKDPGESFEIDPDILSWGLAGIDILKKSFPIDNKLSSEAIVNQQQRIFEEFDARQKKGVEQKPESFFKKKLIVDQPEKTIKSIMSQFCVHNLFCQTLKDGKCLITNTDPVIELNRCPATPEQWYKFQDSDSVTTIIFSPGFNRLGILKQFKKSNVNLTRKSRAYF